jgi:hypothetical protein
MKKTILFATTTAMICGTVTFSAQVIIGGNGKSPEKFSVLELVGKGSNGLRLPQLKTSERDTMTDTDFKASLLSAGVEIMNTDTKCLEYWNATEWIGLCDNTPQPSSSKFVLSVSDKNAIQTKERNNPTSNTN